MITSTNNGTVGDPFIFHELQRRILRGEYHVGMHLPAERTLAQEFRVDRYAVRNALTRLEKEGLIAREPGKRPWVLPKKTSHRSETHRAPMAEKKLFTIMAIFGNHTSNPNTQDILRGVNSILHFKEDSFRLLLFDTDHPDRGVRGDLERRALQVLEHEDISGAIISPITGEETLPIYQRLQEKGLPVVFVDCYPAGLTCDFVGVDNFNSARTAVNHLLNLGHRQIAHLTSSEQIITLQERERGYRQALLEAGIIPRLEWIYHAGLSADVEAACNQFFQSSAPPTAVFAATDCWAHLFLNAAEARGFQIPETMSVVGFDNYERYSLRAPLLTTHHQPFEQIGCHAIKLLIRRLSQADAAALPPQQLLLPTELIVRSSSAPLNEQ